MSGSRNLQNPRDDVSSRAKDTRTSTAFKTAAFGGPSSLLYGEVLALDQGLLLVAFSLSILHWWMETRYKQHGHLSSSLVANGR